MKIWWLAFRPKTLTAAIVPIGVGAALSEAHGLSWPMWVTVCALLAALLIQVATNLLNDAIDFQKGADREDRLGPRRVTQSGQASVNKVMKMGFTCLFFALALGLPLVFRGSWPIVLIGLVSLFLAYGYTGGPFPLAYLGLGDIFVLLFFGVIAVTGLYYLHALSFHWDSVVAGLQVGFLATVLIAINNMRDCQQDARANKKTWAVRFGPGFVRYEILLLISLAYLLSFYWVFQGRLGAALLPLLSMPLGIHLVLGLFKEAPSEKYNTYLAQSAALHLGFGLLFSVGLVV